MKKPIETKPSRAQCWVCLERGINTMYPVEVLQDCGNGTWRCKGHRVSTIIKAGQKHEQEKATTRKWTMKGHFSCEFDIEIEEVKG